LVITYDYTKMHGPQNMKMSTTFLSDVNFNVFTQLSFYRHPDHRITETCSLSCNHHFQSIRLTKRWTAQDSTTPDTLYFRHIAALSSKKKIRYYPLYHTSGPDRYASYVVTSRKTDRDK